MKPTIYRRSRRAHTSNEALQGKDKQKEQRFFGDQSHDPFFKTSNREGALQTIQLKPAGQMPVAPETKVKAEEKENDQKLSRATENEREQVQKKGAVSEEEENIQKKTEQPEEEKDPKKQANIQRKGNAEATGGASANYINTLNGKGVPLPEKANTFFSSRMGYDFSNVKIHTGKDAADSAKELNARAYTLHNNIVFNEGQFDTETSEGKKLMAHELTHVVQQSSHQGDIQTQAVPLLTPAQENTAIQFNRRNYDGRSIRIIQIVTGAAVDGSFGPVSARAVAAFQHANGVAVNGQVDENTLNAIIPGRIAADRREHIIQLVTDFFNIPTSDTLSVRYDPSIGLFPLAATDFEPGNVRLIRLGDLAFFSAGMLRAVINVQLAVPAPAIPALTPRPAILNAGQEIEAMIFNASKFTDSRSIRIIQGFVQANPDGNWGRDTVQRIAQFQQNNGLSVDGKVGLQTLSAFSSALIAAGNQNSSIRLIVDYFNFSDNGNLLDIFYDPGETSNASTDFRVNEPVRIMVGPNGINQTFEGLVHTIAHEYEHARRLKEGIVEAATHEFLGESIEILSVGMPAENLENLVPGLPGYAASFADDASRCLANWNAMPLADRRRFRSKFIAVRNVVRRRIAAGSPVQRALHAALLAGYNAVVLP